MSDIRRGGTCCRDRGQSISRSLAQWPQFQKRDGRGPQDEASCRPCANSGVAFFLQVSLCCASQFGGWCHYLSPRAKGHMGLILITVSPLQPLLTMSPAPPQSGLSHLPSPSSLAFPCHTRCSSHARWLSSSPGLPVGCENGVLPKC